MRLKIGLIGSAANVDEQIEKASQEIGKQVASKGCILITGSGPGLPYEAVKGAKKLRGLTVGFSPASNLQEHMERYEFPTEFFDVLIFTGFGLKGRNVPFIRTCDAVVAVSGRIGTLNEFTIAFDEGKTIGILKGTGGISNSIQEFLKLTPKKGGTVVYNADPRILVTELLAKMKQEGQQKRVHTTKTSRNG